jgi:glycerophosphoryl diester phosphodiesterase
MAAVAFAQREGLAGIVCSVEPLLRAPVLVPTVQRSGLRILTYGRANNEPAIVRAQRAWGVDAIIAGTRARPSIREA